MTSRLVRALVTAIVLLAMADLVVTLLDVDARLDTLYQAEAAVAAAQGHTLTRDRFHDSAAVVALASAARWVAAAMALALVWLAGARADARALALFLAFNSYTDDALLHAGMAHPLLDRLEQGSLFLTLAALLRFAALFPRPLTASALTAAWGRRRARTMAALLDARVVWGGALVLLLGDTLAGAPRGFAQQLAVFTIGLGALVAAVALLRATFGLADDAARRRILWIVAAFAGMLVTGVLYMTISIAAGITDELTHAVLSQLPELVMLCALMFGIFQRGGIDPALVIRRTTVYGVVVLIGIVLFEGVENVASDFLGARYGLLGSIGGSVLAGSVVAAAVRPLRVVSRRATDRLLRSLMPITVLAHAPRVEAAVMFTDIVGSTRLSAGERDSALVAAALLHRTARRVAERHGGRLVKTLGDSVLLEFTAPAAAVAAAGALHGEFAEAARSLDLAAPQLRSGIHAGTVTRAPDGDVFGDVVNIAARLQRAAQPGDIVASSTVSAALSADVVTAGGPPEAGL